MMTNPSEHGAMVKPMVAAARPSLWNSTPRAPPDEARAFSLLETMCRCKEEQNSR